MIRILPLLMLALLAPLAAFAQTLRFDQYDCMLTLPENGWTIDSSGMDRGVLLEAVSKNGLRQVRLEVVDAPDGAKAINDPGLVEGLVAGIKGEGTPSGKGFHWINNDMCYQVCFSGMDGTVVTGTSYRLLIKHGALYTLKFDARYADPCDDRGFNTIANSWVVAEVSGMMDIESNAFEPEYEEYEMASDEANESVTRMGVVLGLFYLIVLIIIPGWLVWFWLTRRKRLMREAEFHAQLPVAPDLELARILLNRKEYSIDAVDIAEAELTRRGRQEQMLELARNESRRAEHDANSDLRLSAAVVERRLMYAMVAGGIAHTVVLGVMIQRALSGDAYDDSTIFGAPIFLWSAVGLILSFLVRKGSWVAAIGLIPSLLFLPLWTSLHLGTLTLLPLLLCAIPAFRAIRAIDDGTKLRLQQIDLATVGWEESADYR